MIIFILPIVFGATVKLREEDLIGQNKTFISKDYGDYIVAFSGYRTLENLPIALKWNYFDHEEVLELRNFDYNGYYVYRSCSARLNGEIYFFGGYTHPTAVRKLTGCSLEPVICEACTTPFPSTTGTTLPTTGTTYPNTGTTFSTSHETRKNEGSLKRTEVSTPIPMEYSTCVESRGEIWIISGDYGDCYKFDGQSFSSCAYTYVGHREGAMVETRSPKGEEQAQDPSPVVIGGCFLQCRYSGNYVEKWIDGKGWTQLAPVPAKFDEIQGHSAVSTLSKIYVFGGLNTDESYKYDVDSNTWSWFGTLQQSRYGHKTITISDMFFHVGGKDEKNVEKWFDELGHEVKMLSELTLKNFAYYPELHLFPISDIIQCL